MNYRTESRDNWKIGIKFLMINITVLKAEMTGRECPNFH